MHHDRLEHPASKQQLEDVWKGDDDMKEEEFEPKTFFMMHGEPERELEGFCIYCDLVALGCKKFTRLIEVPCCIEVWSSGPDDVMVISCEDLDSTIVIVTFC